MSNEENLLISHNKDSCFQAESSANTVVMFLEKKDDRLIQTYGEF